MFHMNTECWEAYLVAQPTASTVDHNANLPLCSNAQCFCIFLVEDLVHYLDFRIVVARSQGPHLKTRQGSINVQA